MNHCDECAGRNGEHAFVCNRGLRALSEHFRPSRLSDMAKKRGYSDEFPTTGKTTRYLFDHIPVGLWRSVRAKAKREGVSVRTLILKLLSDWLQK